MKRRFGRPDSRKNILRTKYNCKRCGKPVFSWNANAESLVVQNMDAQQICWDCSYWELMSDMPPDNIEIIGDKCYQIFPYHEASPEEITGGNKVRYLLKKDGSCIKTNDYWWVNTIPVKYQLQYPPTAWWVSKHFYEQLLRSQHQCEARGCLDRYRCFRYKYQMEFETGPYNKVPLDWVPGGEHCPAFTPLIEIENYTEYVSVSDIIDESSFVSDQQNDEYETKNSHKI